MLLNLGAGAVRVGERMDRADGEVHVPHLFEIEVLHVLRRRALSGGISGERSARLLEDLIDMRLTRYPHTVLLPRIWQLRENLTAYDAAYVALAETLKAPLVTMDARLAQAPGIGAAVEVYR